MQQQLWHNIVRLASGEQGVISPVITPLNAEYGRLLAAHNSNSKV
ncbi:MAG: hypothetical protein QM629_11365 [Parafilimonas sp.]